MPIKPEEVTKYLGLDLDTFENEDAFKTHFDTEFVRRELAHTEKGVQDKVFGKVNSVLRSKIKGFAKAFNIEGLDIDGSDPSDLIDTMKDKVSESVTTLRTELEAAKKPGSGKTTAEVEDMKKQLAAAIAERDAFGVQAKEFEGKYSILEQSITQEKAKARIDGTFARAMDGIQFREDVNAYARKGFEADIRSKYKVEFAEDGTAKVLDASGNVQMNPSKAQTFLSLDEIVKRHAEEAKMIGGNPQGNSPVKRTVTTMATTPPAPQTPAERTGGPRVMSRG